MTLLWEILLQVFGEVLIEFGFAAVGESFRQRSLAHPVVAGVGILILGAMAGCLASLVWPARVFQPGPVRGASLLLSPLVNGVLMDRYGQWRDDRGGTRSSIATFWGGALFAFSMSLVRFVWIGA